MSRSLRLCFLVSLLMMSSVGRLSAAPVFKTVTAPEVLGRQASGDKDLVLIDCRARTDFQIKHIKGAVSTPLFELGFLPLPKDKDLILYCSGNGCNISLGLLQSEWVIFA